LSRLFPFVSTILLAERVADHTFFLDVDDDVRLAQIFRQPRILSAEQSANAAGCGGSRFRLHQDALLVLHAETTPLGFGNHFGIRRPDRPGAGDCFGYRSTALRLAPLRCGSVRSPSLRSAPAKAPEERTPREFPFISSFFFLALLIN
jgi:hypothetical protein